MNFNPEELAGYSLTDANDNAILMHRDAHFGGKFDIMIDYYEREGKGIQPEFELSRIKELDLYEKQSRQNLAGMLLTGPEAERVALAKDAYKKLKELYSESKNDTSKKYPCLIADLILSEDEEPENEMSAIVAEKKPIVSALLNLIHSENYYDPLFPGYGLAPALAAKCLGQIGDNRAITSLFELIGNEEFFNEDVAIDALKHIGEPAKKFLLTVLHGKPITYDNERAAIALVQFKDDPEVAKTCFQMLQELDLKKHTLLGTYLTLACEGLKDPSDRRQLMALGKADTTPSMLKQDIKTISKAWEKKAEE